MDNDHSQPNLVRRAPVASSDVSDMRSNCCCGSFECSYLKRHDEILCSVEKDMKNAARAGKALLIRHETYMVDAERERKESESKMQKLEEDKKELQADNARAIEENRELLDQLESLNGAVSDSEMRVRVLEATLLSSQQTIRRLEGAEARALDMERHIAHLEEEQVTLQTSLRTTETESRCAAQRWRKAEKGISDLQEQLERMEKEAKEENERHGDAVGRLERQRALDRELNTAAGRLKGAAAAKTLNGAKPVDTTVINHFVRDLLQDNANLQVGVAELRDMLMSSNDEIQVLRDQLMFQHSADADDHLDDPFPSTTLGAELDPPRVNQELHIHHHYHAPKPEPKKKRKSGRHSHAASLRAPSRHPLAHSVPSTPPGFSRHSRMSSQAFHTPTQAGPPPSLLHPHQQQYYVTPSPHHLQDTAPPMQPNRWSMLSDQRSEFAPSSDPSSPRSHARNSMLFDRVLMETPASPTTSVDPLSPTWSAHHKRTSDMSALNILSSNFQSVDSPTPGRRRSLNIPEEEANRGDISLDLDMDPHDTSASTICAEDSTTIITDMHTAPGMDIPSASSPLMSPQTYTEFRAASFNPPSTTLPPDHESHPRRLSRALSHESIISVSGTDIHTLLSRPSQRSLRHLGTAVSTTTDVTAHATISRGAGTAMLRSRMYSTVSRRGSRIVSTPIRGSRPAVEEATTPQPNTPTTLGGSSSRPGRWIAWPPWSDSTRAVSGPVTPTVVIEEAESETRSMISATPSATPSMEGRNILVEKVRSPGINQPGSIPGFQEYLAFHQQKGKVPYKPVPERVDLEGLREVLGE